MKNTRRLQAKVQHMALASIIIAGIVAPIVQLAPSLPGMSLQDVKAATGVVDKVDKGTASENYARDLLGGSYSGTTPAMLAGQTGVVDGSWKITPRDTSAAYAKRTNAKGDFHIQYATTLANGQNKIFDGSQASTYDSTSTIVKLTTPVVNESTDVNRTATYMAVSPASDTSTKTASGSTDELAVAAGNVGTATTSDAPTKVSGSLNKLYRFTGKQYLSLHTPDDSTGLKLTNISSYLDSSTFSVKVIYADGTISDVDSGGVDGYSTWYPTSNVQGIFYSVDPKTGALMVKHGTITVSKNKTTYNYSSPLAVATDGDWQNAAGSPATNIYVYSKVKVPALGQQLVLSGNVKMPTNGDMRQYSGDTRMFGAGSTTNTPVNYNVAGNIPETSSTSWYGSYEEGGFNILKHTDTGVITHDVSYTDGTGKSITSGSSDSYNQVIASDKITNTQSQDSTGTYTITTGSNNVTFAKQPAFVNANGDDVSTAVGLKDMTYYDATGAKTTDYAKAVKATMTVTIPATSSYTIKSVFQASKTESITSTTSMTGTDTNMAKIDLTKSFTWNGAAAVTGSINYVDANGNQVATGSYTKAPGSSTSDITAPTTTDGYRYKFVSVDKSTYDGSDIKVTVAKIATGNINYVYNGKTVSSTPFTDQDAGKTIANIAAPAGTVDGLRYKLADATKSYAYPDKDGDVNVDLAAIVSGTIEFVDADNNNALVQQQAFTDQTPGAQISPLTLPDGYVLAVGTNGDVQSTYNYPTTDAQVVTVKVQKLTSGNRNDGMELTEVPSFSSDKNTIGASDTTTLTATKGGVLSYLNLKGQNADIYMSATDLKSNGSALPIKTLKANLSAGLADVYAANQTDGYGHMIVNDTTSKKGSLTIPDLQMTLSNNNFAAGTYSGTINYTMVSDDLN